MSALVPPFGDPIPIAPEMEALRPAGLTPLEDCFWSAAWAAGWAAQSVLLDTASGRSDEALAAIAREAALEAACVHLRRVTANNEIGSILSEALAMFALRAAREVIAANSGFEPDYAVRKMQ